MNKVDIENWSRKEIYQHFSSLSAPFYMVTFRVDVTHLYDYCKNYQISFYYALIYLCTKAMNSIEEFKMVIRDGELYVCDHRDPSFTDLKKGTDHFYIVTMPLGGTIDEFAQEAKNRSMNQNTFLDLETETDELIYYSCLPWMDVTAITNERDYTDPHAKDDLIPRVAWGKYIEENNRKILGLSIDVNHRTIDGYHIGLFAKKLEELIEEL